MIFQPSTRQRASAGRSATQEGQRRDRATSVRQARIAAVCLGAGVVASYRVLDWRVSTALSGALLGLVGLLLLWNRWRPSKAPATAWRRGSEGERLTAIVLETLERRDWVVMHDVALGRTKANIDHIAIGPTGIFVLDSKHWKGRAKFDTRKGWIYGVRLSDTAASTLAERDHVVAVLQDMVEKWRLPVHVAWVMTGVPQPLEEIDGVDVIALRDLISYLTDRPGVMRTGRVRQLVHRAERTLHSA